MSRKTNNLLTSLTATVDSPLAAASTAPAADASPALLGRRAPMMLLAAQPAWPLERRQHPFAWDHFDTSSAPDLTFSPATVSDGDLSADDAPLVARFQDLLASPASAYTTAASAAAVDAPADAFYPPTADWMHGAWSTGAYRSTPRSSAPPRSDANSLSASNWQTFGPQSAAAAAAAPPEHRSRYGQLAGHKRSHSGSTVTSAGPASPFTPLQSYPQIHDPEAHYPSPLLDSFDLNSYAKSIPTSQTFTDSYAHAATAPAYDFKGAAASQASQQQQHHPQNFENYLPSYIPDNHANLAVQAVLRRTMMLPSEEAPPATLQRLPTGEFESNFKAMQEARQTPKIERSLAEVYENDQLYGTALPMGTPAVHGSHSDMFAQRLQAAQGHLANVDDLAGPGQSAAQLRERQKAAADAAAYRQHRRRYSPGEEPQTISPQDAYLDAADVDPDYGPSLFAAGPSPAVSHPAYPSLQRQGSSATHSSTGATPEFPAPLASMESTRSDDDGSVGGSVGSKPAGSMADGGSYTCTHPGCPQRFGTSAALLRHKKEHRPGSPGRRTPASATTTTTPPALPADDSLAIGTYVDDNTELTPAMLAARNSQAGPHRCFRTNPATGKPCNSIFSRPYDLTRHEDTIHNTRKHKVKCPFCTDDKTFSRADALTRHLRVVHPERDVPGRRRRGPH